MANNPLVRRGFTLVELLIVIVIVAVLAAIAIPKISSATRRSHETHLRAKLKSIREGIERVRADTGFWPKDIGQLAETIAPARLRDASGAEVTFSADSWRGPYIDPKSIGLDPGDPTKLKDPICGGQFGYEIGGGAAMGKVTPCASGIALDGSNMACW